MNKLWRQKNPEKSKAIKDKWQKNNPEKAQACRNRWRLENSEADERCKAEWAKNNRSYYNDYFKKKRKEDPIFRLKANLRRLIGRALKKRGFSKKSHTYEILGTDYESVHLHCIEGFVKVYGRVPDEKDKIDIDHIIPLQIAKTEEDVLKLNHYTNLRYLIDTDNRLGKRAKLDWQGPVIAEKVGE